MAAETAWAVNEPAFLNVHAFLNIYSLCICGSSGELCLWTRTSAWQTLHDTKISDALKTFVTSL